LTSEGFDVKYQCNNGAELIECLRNGLPDVVLMDISMPVIDGVEATKTLVATYPDIKVLALSMFHDEISVIKMVRAGARGFIPKDSEPDELIKAVEAILSRGTYYTDLVTESLIKASQKAENTEIVQLSTRETEFLKLACSELTYKEIAAVMLVSPRSVDGYRDSLFTKLNVKSRVGLAIYAIRNGYVDLG
jgi:DNA-binding NarL/FixJ family response regulator